MDWFNSTEASTHDPEPNQTVNTVLKLTHYQFMVILTFIGSFGTVSNGVAMVVMLSSKAMRSKMHNWLIINQTLIDTVASFITAINIPTAPYDMIAPPGLGGDIFCRLWMNLFFIWALFACSTFNLMAITIERYMEVIHPIFHKTHFTQSHCKAVMVSVWVAGLVWECVLAIPSSKAVNGVCYRYVTIAGMTLSSLTHWKKWYPSFFSSL